jgi:hypothetical protein
MKRFLFAVAVVALSACVSFAEDAPAPTPVTSGGPVMMGTAPTYQYAPSQPARRGLFGRLRNRNNTTYYSNTTTTPMMMTAPAGPTTTPPTPMPMPGVRPASGTVAPGTVVQGTGNLPPGTYTATDGTVIQIGGGGPQMTTPTATGTNTQPTRRGLFGRLRY